ncbi:hypothetical protein L7F22_003919 [Adiantum nelumboides]|nr:hypothetical protein [Adiantum nelumboides]
MVPVKAVCTTNTSQAIDLDLDYSEGVHQADEPLQDTNETISTVAVQDDMFAVDDCINKAVIYSEADEVKEIVDPAPDEPEDAKDLMIATNNMFVDAVITKEDAIINDFLARSEGNDHDSIEELSNVCFSSEGVPGEPLQCYDGLQSNTDADMEAEGDIDEYKDCLGDADCESIIDRDSTSMDTYGLHADTTDPTTMMDAVTSKRGDFNNVETFEDWQAAQPLALPHIARCEQDAWDRFLFALAGADVWHTPSFAHVVGSLHFSWGFQRQGGLLLKRLDRFYVGQFAAEMGGVISILPGTSLSDYAPVSLCLLSQRSIAPRWGSRIPDSILQDTELRNALSQIWVGGLTHAEGAAHFLALCIDASSTACRLTVSERRRYLLSRERQLQDRLACIRRRLQEFPGDTFLGYMQRETVDTLTHLQEEKSDFTYHALVSTWISKADRMNKDFFSCFRQRPSGTMVRALRDSLGQLHTCPDEILEMASVYYETLFTSADLLTGDVLDARDEVTRDGHPIIFHDDFMVMKDKKLDCLVHRRIGDMTLEEFTQVGFQKDFQRESKSLHRRTEDGTYLPWNVSIDDSLCTLEEAFAQVSPLVGFNIELKFDNSNHTSIQELKWAIDAVLKVVKESNQGRKLFFSSFHPDAILLIRQEQSLYPALFLTNGVLDKYPDPRRNSLMAALEVSLTGNLQGIVSEVKAILQHPEAVGKIKAAGLTLLTYGDLNNVAEIFHLQERLGVNGLVVDHVPEMVLESWKNEGASLV